MADGWSVVSHEPAKASDWDAVSHNDGTAVYSNDAKGANVIEQALHYATGGLFDKSKALLQAAHLQPLDPGVQAGDFSTRYHQNLQNIRNDFHGYAAQNPGMDKAAHAAGVVTPMLLPMGGGGLLANAGKGAAIGGAYGFGSTNDESLTQDALATLGGAALGAATGTTGYGAGSVAGAGAGKFAIRNDMPKAERQAAEKLLATMQKQGVSQADIIDFLTGTDKPVTMMDMGENSPMQRLGRLLVTMPGKASEDVTQFLNTRQEGQRGRVLNDISQLAPNTDTYGSSASLRNERSLSSDPLYKQAFSNPAVTTDRLSEFMADPDIQRGMARGIKLQRREALARGDKFDPTDYAITGWNEAGDPIIGPSPSWRTLHAGREGLDATIEDFRDPTTGILPKTKDVISLQNLRRAYNQQLTGLNPDLATADAAWAGPSQKIDAMRMGGDFRGLDPEQITATRGRLNAETDPYYQMGAGRDLRNVVNDTRDNREVGAKLVGDQTSRDQLVATFGADKAQPFIDAANAETGMHNTRQFIRGNSTTANKLAEVFDDGWARPALEGAMAGATPGILTGSPLLAVGGGIGGAGLSMARRAGADAIDRLLSSEERNQVLANVLTTTGNKGATQLEALLKPAIAGKLSVAKKVALGRAIGSAIGRGSAGLAGPLLLLPPANSAGQ